MPATPDQKSYEEYRREFLPTSAEINSFKMQQVNTATTVRWWRNGIIDDRNMEIAHVIRCSDSSADLFRPLVGLRMDHVPHRNDPRLRLNSDQREMGCWDFSVNHNQLEDRIAVLEDEVKSIKSKKTSSRIGTAKLSDAKKKPKSKDKGQFDVYRILKQEASDLGVRFDGNPKAEWLREEIKNRTPRPAEGITGDN